MKLINEFKEAPVEDGGEGAFYILFKKRKNYNINFDKSESFTRVSRFLSI